jgi:hypothetical protein
MIRLNTILPMAALSLIMSAIAVQSAKSSTETGTSLIARPIASLPITITKPGYYYFVSDMYTYPTFATPAGSAPAITVNAPGNVTIDLNGFTLSGPLQAFVDGWYANPPGMAIQSSNVTIKNGTIAGFYSPLTASGQYSGGVQYYISNVNIQSVTFTDGGYLNSLKFLSVNKSIVRDCRFGAPEGFSSKIYDAGSQTGNRYINDTFDGPYINPIQIQNDVPRIVLSITPQ